MIKSLLSAILILFFLELAAFIAVAASIGFGWTLILLLATSLLGALILRHAGADHIARIRLAAAGGSISLLRADGIGGLVLLGGFLLLVPGFITDVAGSILLLAPLWSPLMRFFDQSAARRRHDSVIDLEPEQWRHVRDPQLPNGGRDSRKQS